MNLQVRFKEVFRASTAGRWYHSREPSERPVIVLITTVVVVGLLWVAIWKPVSDWHSGAQNRFATAHQLVDWMQANETQARAAAASGGAGASSERLSIQVITRAANAHGLKLNRLQPEDNGVVSVVLQNQPFNKVFAWIAQLQENNSVSVQRASFSREDALGYVNAQLRFALN